MPRKSLGSAAEAIPNNKSASVPNDISDPREVTYANADEWWKSCAQQAMHALATCGRPFDADQLAMLVPRPDHPCRYGALFAAAVRREQIMLIGSRLSAEDGRPLRLWQGCN